MFIYIYILCISLHFQVLSEVAPAATQHPVRSVEKSWRRWTFVHRSLGPFQSLALPWNRCITSAAARHVVSSPSKPMAARKVILVTGFHYLSLNTDSTDFASEVAIFVHCTARVGCEMKPVKPVMKCDTP